MEEEGEGNVTHSHQRHHDNQRCHRTFFGGECISVCPNKEYKEQEEEEYEEQEEEEYEEQEEEEQEEEEEEEALEEDQEEEEEEEQVQLCRWLLSGLS